MKPSTRSILTGALLGSALVGATLAAALGTTGCGPRAPGAGSAAPMGSSPDTSHGAALPAPAPTNTAGAPAPGSAEARWVGEWRSASCGKRAYERLVRFGADGNFEATERVSPCPPGARCVWSGIVTWGGRYAAAAAGITLEPEGARPPQASALVLPTELGWDSAAGAPVETQQGERCVYQPRR
jgi:hypothetical protein